MIVQIIGIIGAILVLIGFALLRFHIISATGWIYNGLNILGGLLLLGVSIHDMMWGFIILNAFWMSVSIIALIKERMY